MERSELVALLSPEGLDLLDAQPTWSRNDDTVRRVSELRRQGHPPDRVSAVLNQSRLRARAAEKFGDFAARMLFTPDGLEQATRLRVAAVHAGRFTAAGIDHVADLGCGIGGDAMAFAALGLQVSAVERDEITAAIASYNLAPFPTAHVEHADATDVDLSTVEGIYVDPARRTHGPGGARRLTRASDYSPGPDWAFGLADGRAVGVKLGPGTDRDVIPEDAEAQWVSVDGSVVELGVWLGAVARDGVRRAALVLGADGAHELTAMADSDDVEVGALGEYVWEPDGSVIRARLIGTLARDIGARMLSAGIAYMTSDDAPATPFAQGFRVRERLPADERRLRQALRERRIGALEIKKRGIDVDPAALRTRLKLLGDNHATIIVTREAGRHVVLLVERA